MIEEKMTVTIDIASNQILHRDIFEYVESFAYVAILAIDRIPLEEKD